MHSYIEISKVRQNQLLGAETLDAGTGKHNAMHVTTVNSSKKVNSKSNSISSSGK